MVIGLLASVAGLIAFRSKIAHTPRDPIQKNDETDFPFVVKNENPYGLSDLRFYCLIDRIETSNSRPAQEFGVGHIGMVWNVRTLGRNAVHTVRCNVSLGAGGTAQRGTISILTRAKAFGIIPVEQCDRFEGVRGTSWTWLQQECGPIDLSKYAMFAGGDDPTHLIGGRSGYRDIQIRGVTSFSDPIEP